MGHGHLHSHRHSHGVVDPSIVRSHAGLRAVGLSLAVLAAALGWERADPIIGLAITLVILRITWQAWHTIRRQHA